MNLRPLGYEPNELPDCSTPRHSSPWIVVSGRAKSRGNAPNRQALAGKIRCCSTENRAAPRLDALRRRAMPETPHVGERIARDRARCQACERMRFAPGLSNPADVVADLRLRVGSLMATRSRTADRLTK